MMSKRIAVYLLIVFFAGMQSGYAQHKTKTIETSETLVCAIDPSVQPEAFRASPDGRRLAYEAIKDGKRILFLDGKEKTDFNYISESFFISNFIFSPDGKRAAYQGYANRKHYIFVDGENPAQYEIPVNTFDPPITFSPDSQHVAYTAGTRGSGQFVVVDGRAEKGYSQVSAPRFTFDSKGVCYIARDGQKQFVVIGGEEKKGSSDIVLATMSPWDNRMVYVMQQGGKYVLVADGQEGPLCDQIKDIIFSPSGNRMAYAARQDDKWFVVADGKKGKDYRDYWEGTLRFSADGKRLAYIASDLKCCKKQRLGQTETVVRTERGVKTSPQWVIVVDGKEMKRFDYGTPFVNDTGWEKPKGDGAVVFSPNGKRIAYVALSSKLVKKKFKSGQHVTEIAFGMSKKFVVVDGREQTSYDEIRPESLVFSRDNRHLAYVVKTGDQWSVVVDGKECNRYDAIVSYGGRVIFDDAGVSYMARDGKNIYRVEEHLN